MTPPGELELARALLKPDARRKLPRSRRISQLNRPAPRWSRTRVCSEAMAMAAMGRQSDAYAQAMDSARNLYPHSGADTDARTLAYLMLTANPALAPTATLDYRKSEAELLLREGQPVLAMAQIEHALASESVHPDSAPSCCGSKHRPRIATHRARRAHCSTYLAIAPAGRISRVGAERPGAALLARGRFRSRSRRVPANRGGISGQRHAPGAMLRLGRIDEELRRLRRGARAVRAAVREISVERVRRGCAFSRAVDLFHDRALRVGGADVFRDATARAQRLGPRHVQLLARASARKRAAIPRARAPFICVWPRSIDSNYYPALASRRVAAAAPELPAASASDPSFAGVPSSNSAIVRFHLSRIDRAAGGWYEGARGGRAPRIGRRVGGRSESRLRVSCSPDCNRPTRGTMRYRRRSPDGEARRSGPAESERIRYPRAYWDLFSSAAIKRPPRSVAWCWR